MTETRRVAVIGGNRIPFARQNGAYAKASNQDMLTAAIEGLVARHGLAGRAGRRGRRRRGPQARPRLQPDPRGGPRVQLAPTTPAYDVQQACGTGLEAAILVANKIALGQIDVGHRRWRRHRVRRARSPSTRGCARRCSTSTAPRRSQAARQGARPGCARRTAVPEIPRNVEPRTGLSMGEHMALTAARVGDHP